MGTRPIIGREAEVDQLERVLAAAGSGGSRLVVVEGELGIGKSALLRHITHMARERGFLVGEARCCELTSGFPFDLVRQLLEPHLFEAGPEEVKRLGDGPCGAAVDALVSSSAGTAGYSLMRSIVALLRELGAGRPILLAIDDFPYADTVSLRCLSYLLRCAGEIPIVCLLTRRTGVRAPDGTASHDIDEHPERSTLRLGRLDEAQVGEIVRDRYGSADAGFVAACAEATAGNPFFLEELLGGLSGTDCPSAAGAVRRVTPEALPRRVWEWVFRAAGDPGVMVISALALLGPSSLSALAATTGLPEHVTGLAIERMTSLGLLVGPDQPEFVHPIVPRSLRRSLAAAQSGSGYGPHRTLPPAVERTLEPLWSIANLRRAADRALADEQQIEALSFLRRADSLRPSGGQKLEVMLQIGALERLIDPQRATCRFKSALETAPAAERLTITCAYGDALQEDRRYRQAAAVLKGALNHGAGAADPAGAASAAGRLLCLAQLFPSDDMAELAARYGPLAEAHPAGRGLTEAVRVVRAAAEGDRSGAVPSGPVAAATPLHLLYLGLSFIWAERFDLLESLLSRADGAALPHLRPAALTLEAMAAQRSGRPAAAYAQAAGLYTPEAGVSDDPLTALQLSVMVDSAAYVRQQDIRFPPPAAAPDMWLATVYRASLARLTAERGDHRAAARELLACGELLSEAGVDNPAVVPWRSQAALLFHRLGDPVAHALIGEETELAERWGAPRAHGIALRAAGLVQEGRARIERLEESVAVLTGSPDELELCRSQTDLGRALRAAGMNAEARSVLYDARALAQKMGVTSLVELVHFELVRTGARPRRHHATGPQALTSSEARVADLAAKGLSNPEIGQRLFIAARTVETHLTRVYRKLGISSRAQLHRALK
ncbi:BREX system ATP-binding domain-containing protein [Streptomyces eurythermus]